ncbi:calcium homeostasis modulator protein 2 [Salvelinus sp. IW2-2015]|uniref:calcium homeostasis modulator protein 2 n=1 Tax=Salvelinus sp. IW2-2015 TaxID=2691554 RepID=UPI000CDFC1FD|nr:calcium homeostasis modulator protein 6-like [Salvelinus alpinus]
MSTNETRNVYSVPRGQSLPTKPVLTIMHHWSSCMSAYSTTALHSQTSQSLFTLYVVSSSMERRQQWLSRLKSEFGNSPLVSNVAFGFILMGLEKLVELEFECPCDPKWNGLFSSAFFVIPAIMAFMLMLIIQDCRYDLSGCPRTVSISSLVPPIVWLILLFLDGQYFACALTDWNGRFVIVDKAAPQKWCEPPHDDGTLQDLMVHSQELFVESQVIGIALLIFICVGLIVYVIRESCQQEEELQEVNNTYEMYEMT